MTTQPAFSLPDWADRVAADRGPFMWPARLRRAARLRGRGLSPVRAWHLPST